MTKQITTCDKCGIQKKEDRQNIVKKCWDKLFTGMKARAKNNNNNLNNDIKIEKDNKEKK